MALKIGAVIPAYNEEDIIYSVVKHLVDEGIFVHVLDNESTDKTLAQLKSFSPLQVSFSSFSSNNEFNEQIQGDNIRKAIETYLKNCDWIIKCDADEFLESPYEGVSVRQMIESADKKGFNAIGSCKFQFYPMSSESHHVAGDDVRKYYNYFERWQGNKSFGQEMYHSPHDLWKINCFKSGLKYFNPKNPEPLSAVKLFPSLFIIRHYPFRNPERTRKRLIDDRKKRLSQEMLARYSSEKYLAYKEEDTFLFDNLLSKSTTWGDFEVGQLFRFSEFKKLPIEEFEKL